ncbi:MAG: SDR family oxidoreductase [Ideonella sp.]|jgi:NAD(P)-dependent dehydrogenase (short-subunit alcohol dehydrogenase family)|nr:SDR family oxidoreductase [Ideonella sp.]
MVPSGLARFRLDGQVCVITGGGQGIGRACADLFEEAGATVVIVDREASDRPGALAIDVSDASAVERAFDAIAARHGGLDVLVNNAGVSIRKPSDELSLDEWNRVVAVNLTAAFVCARTALRHFGRRDAGVRGAVVNTASIMGLSGGGLYPNISYQTTKGGLVNMTRALAVEWAPRGIRVNAVAPTWTRTGFIGQLETQPDLMARIRAVTPLQRLAEPEEVAAAMLFLASPAASMVTGHVLAVDGGFLAQ